MRVAAVLVPKELKVAAEQKTPGGLYVEEWQILRRVVDLIKANAPGGELGPTLELIENSLRADQAKLIGRNESRAAGKCGVDGPAARVLL
jgi:hypothetical protein